MVDSSGASSGIVTAVESPHRGKASLAKLPRVDPSTLQYKTPTEDVDPVTGRELVSELLHSGGHGRQAQ
jgi:hypothetical protein